MIASSFETFISSFALVAVSEMGDKTQLLAFSLACRYKKPVAILLGILAATTINHGLSALIGAELATLISQRSLSWILGASFVACGFWALVPDTLDDSQTTSNLGAFLTTVGLIFLAEMGDKTQLATIALAARFQSILFVTLGTTAGMMFTNTISVYAGARLAERVNMSWMRAGASALFFAFGFYSFYLAAFARI